MCIGFIQWLKKKWATNVTIISRSEGIVQAQVNDESVVNLNKRSVVSQKMLERCYLVSEAMSLPYEKR